ncbi:MAG: 1-(5-phosphoribosyl)-5-[(5-phosphoribosylamino) methylideneamino] imidazole-4-carboxamide isomerase [Candidatus Hydrogenedentota bacterium]
MRVLPAVDIRGGLCVNLVQGDYDQETVFSSDPVEQARLWHSLGGDLVHIVDLDGARVGEVRIESELTAIVSSGIPVEVGGGIRSMAAVDALCALGVDRVILGTAAHDDPAFLLAAAEKYPGKIAVGIDAKAGKVALHAWKTVTDTEAVAFARDVERAGAARIIYTDILSDGMMLGPNYAATRAVAEAVSIPVTLSGGVSSLENIRRARALEPAGVDEIIIGRALYLGAFTVPEALAAAREGV